MKKIATVYSGYKEKFGIPRQSGLAESVMSKIVFEPEYGMPEAFKGIEEFSHLWIIWEFSKSEREEFSPTVRPPRLGGNERKGVFATRSPFRPNGLGLSSVKLVKVEFDSGTAVLYVSGADILDGTPVYDVKPYIKYSDCHNDAKCSFADEFQDYRIEVKFECEVEKNLKRELTEILSLDPRPSYQEEGRIYGMNYKNSEIKFTVENAVLKVISVTK